MTLSPTAISIGMRCPSSNRPGPTAMTSPSCGCSLAVSGMTMPDALVSSSSLGWTAMRSSSGFNPNDALMCPILPVPQWSWAGDAGPGDSRGVALQASVFLGQAPAFLGQLDAVRVSGPLPRWGLAVQDGSAVLRPEQVRRRLDLRPQV